MQKRARNYAIKAHGDQKYDEHPYYVHLDAVAKIVRRYGAKAEVVAYLHDVVEDTSKTGKDIEKIFGELTAKCVLILSDEPGETRKARKEKTYKKMSLVRGEETLALLVKAADRLANMRTCIRTKDKTRLLMYKSEYKVFRKSAYRENLCEDIWQELEKLQNMTIHEGVTESDDP